MLEAIFRKSYRLRVSQLDKNSPCDPFVPLDDTRAPIWYGEVDGMPMLGHVKSHRSEAVALALIRNRCRFYLRECRYNRIIPGVSFEANPFEAERRSDEIWTQERVKLSVLCDLYNEAPYQISRLLKEGLVYDTIKHSYIAIKKEECFGSEFCEYMVFSFKGVYEECDIVDGCVCDDYCFVIDNNEKMIHFYFFKKNDYRDVSVVYLKVKTMKGFSIDSIVIRSTAVEDGAFVFYGKSQLSQRVFFSVNEYVFKFVVKKFSIDRLYDTHTLGCVLYFSYILTSVLFERKRNIENEPFRPSGLFDAFFLDRLVVSIRSRRSRNCILPLFDTKRFAKFLEDKDNSVVYKNEAMCLMAMMLWAEKSRFGELKDRVYAVVVISRFYSRSLDGIFRSLQIILKGDSEEHIKLRQELRLDKSKAHKQKVLNILKNKIAPYAKKNMLPMPPHQIRSMRVTRMERKACELLIDSLLPNWWNYRLSGPDDLTPPSVPEISS